MRFPAPLIGLLLCDLCHLKAPRVRISKQVARPSRRKNVAWYIGFEARAPLWSRMNVFMVLQVLALERRRQKAKKHKTI